MNELSHNVVLNNKSDLVVTGIKSVDTFDDGIIVATALDGSFITVEGNCLAIKDVNLDKGVFTANGNIYSFSYSEQYEERPGFFKRIFKSR